MWWYVANIIFHFDRGITVGYRNQGGGGWLNGKKVAAPKKYLASVPILIVKASE